MFYMFKSLKQPFFNIFQWLVCKVTILFVHFNLLMIFQTYLNQQCFKKISQNYLSTTPKLYHYFQIKLWGDYFTRYFCYIKYTIEYQLVYNFQNHRSKKFIQLPFDFCLRQQDHISAILINKQYFQALCFIIKLMDWLGRQIIHNKISWIKEKGYWLIIVICLSITVFFATLLLMVTLFFVFEPDEYKVIDYPQFQSSKRDDYKLVAVYQNPQLKNQLCSGQSFTYTGRSLDQQQFCNFKYQPLPQMGSSFDVTIIGLKSMQIRYVSVCLLKMPRQNIRIKTNIANASQTDQFVFSSQSLTNRYVCQKYRAYQDLHIINDMQINELYFLQVQLELTNKGFQSIDFVQAKLVFQEWRNHSYRFFVDYYFWIAIILSFSSALWISFITVVIGLSLILRQMLVQKERKQQELMQNLKKLKVE